MARKKRYTEEEENQIYESIVSQSNNHTLKTTKIDIKYKNENQRALADLIEKKEITICKGPAGSGKTFIACAQALRLFKNDLKYKRIYIVKSVTALKEEEIGFLKGTLEEKMEPYVFSFIHNFEKIVGRGTVQTMRANKSIEVMPVAFLRGINFDNCMLPGTTVKLSDGEEIEVSDLFEKFMIEEKPIFVQSYNLDTEQVEIQEMSTIARKPIGDNPVYEIETEDGRIIKLTGKHKLWVKDKGYLQVSEITEDDELLSI